MLSRSVSFAQNHERVVVATSPEVYLISAVIKKSDHITPAARGITRRFFHAYPDEWTWIEKYISRNKRAPSKGAFLGKFPTFRLKKVDDVEHYCEEVRKAHIQVELTASVSEIIERIEDGDVDMAVRSMHHHALQIESQMSGLSNDADIIEHWQETYDEVMARAARQEEFGQAGLPTGFPTLDERTGGPQAGHVWIVAARLGQGKTWSLVRMAVAACFSGHSIQYDALEQGRAEIAMRVHTFASSEYGKQVFKNLDLSQGRNFSPRDYKMFLQELRQQVSGRFHVADTSKGPIAPLTIGAQIERNRPDGLYLDYLTLMEADEGGADDWKGIGRLSKSLKQMAERYQIPIIAAAQLNRQAAVGKDLAGPETLAEADSIGRDADAVITMRQMSKRVIAMKLAKFRHGRDGFIWYTRFLPNTGYFEEINFDEAQDIIAEDRDEDEDEDAVKFKPRKKGSFQEMAAKKRAGHGKGGLVDRTPKKTVKVKKTSPPAKRVVVRKKVSR